jgi:glycosyltransferase involved in cell wall biosynthesis
MFSVAMIASNQGTSGGGEYIFVLLAIGLHERGCRVRYLCSMSTDMDHWASMLSKVGVEVVRKPMRSYLSLPGRVLQAPFDSLTRMAVESFLLEDSYDVVHVNQQNAEDGFNIIPTACKLMPGRVIGTIHNPHPLAIFGTKASLVRAWMTRKLHVNYAYDRILVANSGSKTFTDWISNFSGSLNVVPNGIGDSNWLVRQGLASDSGDSGNTSSISSVIPINVPVIGMACRLTAQKDIGCALMALKVVLKTHPDLILAIGGTGEEESSLQKLVVELGLIDAVYWLGQLDTTEMEHFYRRIDLLLLSSRWEGLPLVMLESLRRGVPVVATAVDGCVEVLMDRPGLGRLAAPGDPFALAVAISDLLNDPAQPSQCQRDGPQLCAGTYGLRAMVDGYYRKYTSMVACAATEVPSAT